MANAPALPPSRPKPRLQKPSHIGIDDSSWQILTDSVFPTATDPNVIALAWEVCRIRKLDIFRHPYHIRRSYNKLLKREVEQLMPGINEALVNASRTGEFMGNDTPIYGPEITETFHGKRTRTERGQEVTVDTEITVSYPETIEVVVYRHVKGEKCAFRMPVRWREEYQTVGAGPLPNDMWAKRVYDQSQKVALAASLRLAFPDVCESPPEDLTVATLPGEGGDLIEIDVQNGEQQRIQKPAEPQPPTNPQTGEVLPPHDIKFLTDEDGTTESWREWGGRFIAAIRTTMAESEIDAWLQQNRMHIDNFKGISPDLFATFERGIKAHRDKIKKLSNEEGGDQ